MDEKAENKISRRQFLGLAGGVIGAGVLASIGLNPWLTKNKRELDLDSIEYQENETDILVIGGGMAGLFAAVKGYDAGSKVLMVSKGRLGTSGQTPFAKGMFVYDSSQEKLSLDAFTAKVSASALKTNNPVYTRQMAEHSMARVNELKKWGFFSSVFCHNAFMKPIKERNIPVMERIMITHLIKGNGKIAGAAGFSFDDAKIHIFKSKSVILCTGAGGFKPNGFPICDLTHDGTVMAYNIGAKVTGKEWNDGHSGMAENAADCYNGWHGMFERTPGVTGIEVHHDLGVDENYQAYMLGNPVKSGPGRSAGKTVQGGPYTPEEFIRQMPSGGDGPSVDGGHEGGAPSGPSGASVGGSSAGMSIHKSEGLVPINEKGESNIPGLYAAGDALGSYMAGAIYTQIGSSLSGSAVQGAIVSEAAAEYCKKTESSEISTKSLTIIKKEILAPLKRDTGYSPAWVTQILQGIMIPNFVIYIKKERILNAALAYVEELRDHHVPMLRAANLHELRLAHETSNMIINAEMKLRASLMRKESRCSHYRLDYPDIDYQNWQAWINISKDVNGFMKLEKQAFSKWPGY
ncbi:MAG: FAD-binding protein [Candidatus Omnitrophica bacterium]|nr:FAD-binding protein [Candidatus Omnitrophota bacterium]